MNSQQDRRERERDAAVDLSFSQILEVRSSSYKRRPQSGSGVPRSSASGVPRFQQQQRSSGAFKTLASSPSGSNGRHNLLDSVYEEPDEGNSLYSPMDPRQQERSREARVSSFTEDEEWATGDDGQIGQDMYRFVQPRRLSSWVQDDAVNACFKCHALFTLIVRKHHCRACGRIFCSACSSQRVVIPGDYESTPASPSYNSLTSNASDLMSNISWYFVSYSSPNSSLNSINSHHPGMNASSSSSYMEASQRGLSPEVEQEKFLKEVQRLQKAKVIGNFTPCANRNSGQAPSTKSYMSSHVPDGSVMQRVCDDCACSLQQRRNHYNIVKVFELCGLDLQQLRTVGQVCRKWHRASIMCLSMFRQIQYYLPTHRLSEREKALLIINRRFLAGHTKWILQLVKAIDFSSESENNDGKGEPIKDEPKDKNKTGGGAYKEAGGVVKKAHASSLQLAQEVLSLMVQERKHKCMLTMCSRLCKPQIGSVDALEILADENIRNVKLRAMCVDALLNSATENEWLSFLPVLLQSLSIESNAATSKLGQALFRQAHCDIRFCYDFYWGLTVTSEDASCRRKFDGMKQRLLLTLSQFKHNASYGPLDGVGGKPRHDDIAEQLLRGQEFVDLMWKVPHRVPIRDVRQHFQDSVEKSLLFEGLDKLNGGGNDATSPSASGLLSPQNGHSSSSRPLLRLPVDPLVKVSGINYKTIEVKRSAEAPMIITCTGVERDDEEDEGSRPRRNSSNAIVASTDPLHQHLHPAVPRSGNGRQRTSSNLPFYRLMYKRDDLRKDAVVQNIINVMYLILKQETRLDIPLVTYRVLPTSSFDGLIEIVENAHTLYSIIRDHGSILNFLHHYNGHRTLSEISTSFRESLAAYTVITFLLGVGDRHADNVMLTKEGILFHIDYGFILGKDPKPLQPPMRLDHYMIEALGGSQTEQFEQFKKLCVIAFNCLRRHVSLFMILLNLVVKAVPEITDFDMNYTQSDLEAFVVERFLPGQTDDEAATALGLRMEGKLNEKIGLKLSDFVHAHANEKTVSKGMTSVGSSVKIGVEAVEATVSTVASSLTSGASSIYNYVWGGSGSSGGGGRSSAVVTIRCALNRSLSTPASLRPHPGSPLFMGVNASAEAARLRSLRVMEGPHASAFAAHAHLPSATVSTSATVTVKTAAAAMEETIALIAQEQLAATKSSSTTKHFSLKKPKHSTRFHHQPAGSVRIDEVLDADLLGVCARFLDFASLSACELVNSHWRELLSDPVIWEQLYCDRWRGGRVLTLPPADRRVLLPHFKNVCRQRIANSHVRMCTRARTWMRKSGNVFVHNDSMELRDFGLGCTESIRTEHALRPLASCIDGGDGDGLVNPICYFEATVAGCGSVGLASISSAAERKAYGFGSDNHLGWYPVSYGYHGDDGMFYWNAGRRTPAALGGLHRDFGPRWGDTTPFRVRNANTTTIGCGLLGDNAQREVFFTLNGEFVGVSPVQLEPGREYAAAVSLHQFGDSVELNFGAAAFAFDVEQFAWKKLQALREKALLERDGE